MAGLLDAVATASTTPSVGAAVSDNPIVKVLMGNVPTPEDMLELQDKKQGALDAMKAANSAPMRGKDYTPFQDMVTTYLANMVPGWNQYGLGRAIAMPNLRAMEDAKTMRGQEIARTKTELGDAEQELKNAISLQRAGIGAGAGLAKSLYGANSAGKWKHATTEAGDIIWWNDVTGQREIVPSDKTKLHASVYKTVLEEGVKNKDPEAHDKAVAYANAAVLGSPQSRTDAKTSQLGTVPLVQGKGTPSAVSAPSEEPLVQVGGPGTNGIPDTPLAVMPTTDLAPVPQSKPVFDYATLPPKIQATIQAILDRSDANDNPELARAGMKEIQKLVAPFETERVKIVNGDIDELSRDQRMNLATPKMEGHLQELKADPAAGIQVAQVPTATVTDVKPALRPITSNSQIEAQRKSAGEEQGKTWHKERADLNQASVNAMHLNGQLDMMERLIKNENVPQGQGAEMLNSIRSYLISMGVPIDKNKISPTDMVAALSTNYALHQRTAGGVNLLPGAMSNYEDRLLKSIAPGLMQTKEGALAMIRLAKASNEANMRIAKAANDAADANKEVSGLLPSSWQAQRQDLEKREALKLKVLAQQIAEQFKQKLPEVKYGE